MAERAPALPTLATARTLLRPHRARDFATYRRWLRMEAVNHLTMADPTYAPLIAQRTLAWMRSSDAVSFAVCVAGARGGAPPGTLIGIASLTDLEPRMGSGELRIRLGEPSYWGFGHGGEATWLLCSYGLGELGLRRINLSVFDFNQRAIRCYQRVGFRETGRRVRAVWRDGRLHDEIVMSLSGLGDPPAPRPTRRA